MRSVMIAIFLLFSCGGWAQKIENVQVKVHDDYVAVSYEMSGCESADVALFLSLDGGNTFFDEPLQLVAGDVGESVSAGHNQIAWAPLGDFPLGVAGNMVFKVRMMGNIERSQATVTVNGISFDMVRVKGGSFLMGTPDHVGPAEDGIGECCQVTLSEYYIGKTEVTQALWNAVMGSIPCEKRGDHYPVENISWQDAQDFVQQLNSLTGYKFALPTEAQWEYAARGGHRSGSYRYSGSDHLDLVGWYAGNSQEEIQPVGGKQPNELGIYDMSGNVCEWCQDWYGNYPEAAQTDPQGPRQGFMRVQRGGSYWNEREEHTVYDRESFGPTFRSLGNGLRIVCTSFK